MRIRKPIHITLITAGVVIAGIGLLYGPLIYRYGSTMSQVGMTQAELVSTPLTDLQAAELKLTEAQARAANQTIRVAEGVRPQGVLAALADASDRSGIDSYDTSLLEPRGYKAYHTLPVRVSAVGGFQPIFEMLREVETSPRLMRVNRLVMTRDDNDRERPLMRVRSELELEAYHIPAMTPEARHAEPKS